MKSLSSSPKLDQIYVIALFHSTERIEWSDEVKYKNVGGAEQS